MRKIFCLLVFCLLLGGCSRDPLAPMSETAGTSVLPVPAIPGLPQSQDQALIWFRLGDEPFLAPESREITHSRTESHAMALMQTLLEGPSAASTELTHLFPQGTRVISVTQAERVMFVTLSRHIMNGYSDEPANWRDRPEWAAEVPLRRQLAMQSIAATLTENCEVDTVVILVEQTNAATDSLRLRQSYYTLDGSTTLAEPLLRDESLLLTPARTAEVILQCWQEQSWSRLYRYVAAVDPASGAVRPSESDFTQAMTNAKPLLNAEPAGGSISADGQSAVFSVSGAWLDQGHVQPFSGMLLRLNREKGIWRVGHCQLIEEEARP